MVTRFNGLSFLMICEDLSNFGSGYGLDVRHHILTDNFLVVSFSVKIFDIEFSPDLYVLKSLEPQKVVFENWSKRMYVCDCVSNV